MWHAIVAIGIGVLAGVALATLLIALWDDIAYWLNNTAANAVEKALGYKASLKMKRATTTISKLRESIISKAVIYTRKSSTSEYYDRTTYTAPMFEVDSEIVKKIEEEGQLVNEFTYEA